MGIHRVGQLLHIYIHIHAHIDIMQSEKKRVKCVTCLFLASLVYLGCILCCIPVGSFYRYFVFLDQTEIVLYGLSTPLAYEMTTETSDGSSPNNPTNEMRVVVN